MVHRAIFKILGILSMEKLASSLNLEVSIKGAQNRFPLTPLSHGMSPHPISMILLVLSLVPRGIGYGPGKHKGPGTRRGLVRLLITPYLKILMEAMHVGLFLFLVMFLG